MLERQARQFFLKLQERQTGETNEVKLHDFIRENFEIVEFDEDVIIFCDEYEQTYEHDIV
ncbi:hypothetical protein F4V48_01085 [Lactococcus lactis subsp. hordniae]|uniref:Uncharacterized protein n=1 Tax=Lactococcus lactis subsp. hordniae TaxID=203404 RepID=A0A5M9QA12_LACLH|nr:hypothetical protein F4V48_01085 [Lactococcus lactis subsp. hordniae]MCT3134219.1 hypothetical protein [Lactococcus lactis]